MKWMVSLFLVLSALAGMCGTVAGDSSLRCGTRLISVGSPMDKVLEACGDPDRRDQWEESPHSDIFRIFDYKTERYHLPELIRGPLRMERWTYNLGPNRFIRYLEFENGVLIRIQTGERGHNKGDSEK